MVQHIVLAAVIVFIGSFPGCAAEIEASTQADDVENGQPETIGESTSELVAHGAAAVACEGRCSSELSQCLASYTADPVRVGAEVASSEEGGPWQVEPHRVSVSPPSSSVRRPAHPSELASGVLPFFDRWRGCSWRYDFCRARCRVLTPPLP